MINHTKIEKCLLLLTANTYILILLYRELKTDDRSFIFAVYSLVKNRSVKLPIVTKKSKHLGETNALDSLPLIEFTTL